MGSSWPIIIEGTGSRGQHFHSLEKIEIDDNFPTGRRTLNSLLTSEVF
jgi:hypothetical protein